MKGLRGFAFMIVRIFFLEGFVAGGRRAKAYCPNLSPPSRPAKDFF